MATAKHRAIDQLPPRHAARAQARGARPRDRGRRKPPAPDFDAALDDDVGDDLLRLMFTACHPVLSTEARVALTLRLLGGLTTDEIARAFLVPEPTIAQRIVRAKRTLADEQVPFEVPRGAELARAAGVGARSHLPRSSTKAIRRPPATTGCGRRCARTRCVSGACCRARAERAGGARPGGVDGDPGVALAARVGADGRADPAARSGPRAVGSAADPPRPGGARARASARRRARPYTLQAAIAACHARRATADETDWRASSRSMTSSPRSRRRRSSNSIARWRCRWHTVRPRPDDRRTRCGRMPMLELSVCCRRPGRPAREAGSRRGSANGIRARGGADQELARAGEPARPRQHVRRGFQSGTRVIVYLAASDLISGS